MIVDDVVEQIELVDHKEKFDAKIMAGSDLVLLWIVALSPTLVGCFELFYMIVTRRTIYVWHE